MCGFSAPARRPTRPSSALVPEKVCLVPNWRYAFLSEPVSRARTDTLVQAFIDSVTEGAEPPPPEVRITLNVVRAIRFARRQENGSTDLDPFDRLARFEHEVSRRLKKASLELSKEQQISLSALRHKIIISFALRQRYFSPNRPPTLETKHLISTHCGVLELLKNDLVGLVAAPQIAQEIRAAFTELFPVEKLFQPLPGQQQQQKKKKNKATRRR